MAQTAAMKTAPATTVISVLRAASLCHLLNDRMQALLPATYPIFQEEFGLSFAQVGLLTFFYQITASLFSRSSASHRPPSAALLASRRHGVVARRSRDAGLRAELRRPAGRRHSSGSRVSHLPSGICRIARFASGVRHGLAQSVFQVGGDVGSALGPLAAAFIVLPRGQPGLAWFALATVPKKLTREPGNACCP